MFSNLKVNIPSDERLYAQQHAHPVRASVRFPIQLDLRLQTPQGEVTATTENISASGLLFLTDRILEPDTKIEFTLAMPAAVLGADADIVVNCLGRVVRSEKHGSRVRAAAVIDEYFFKA
ncbi:MAG: PilZ domain-containing protein [Acidobacteriaceae bacterium]